MLNLINPVFLVKKFTKMYREIENFTFYRKQTKALSESSKGNMYNLKRNKKGNLYTAINLEPELRMYHTGRELEGLEKTYVGNKLSRFNDLFLEYEILELVKLKWTRVYNQDYYAYIIHTKFRWRETSFGWILWYMILITCLVLVFPYIKDFFIMFFS